ncbi:hypothetical protein OG407_09710 [Streptomyces sp. NBC_01515]|uniref:hypothetical protein n=1 Tax=Streptomyces sp. NBC_01515 TaxID=2903890 RepID=UPI0038660458
MSTKNDHATWSETTSDLHVSPIIDEGSMLWQQPLKPQLLADAELESARTSKRANWLSMVASAITILSIIGFTGHSGPEVNCDTNRTGNQVTNSSTNNITYNTINNIVQNYGTQETAGGDRRGK